MNKLLEGQLKFMNQFFEVIAISSPGLELKKISKAEGVETIAVEISRMPHLFKDLITLIILTYNLIKIKPDIVHTHTPKAGLLGMIAAFVVRTPVRIHTVAGIPWIEFTGIKKKLFKFIERITYKCSSHVYCNSYHLMHYILENKIIHESKISVIGNGSSNGINTSYFDIDKKIRAESNIIKSKLFLKNEKVLIFIGRIVKDKGIEELVKSFILLQKKRYNIKLLLVGPLEPKRDPISDVILNLISKNTDIIMTDYIEDIRPYLCLSYALVFPSYREGFPNVPMQAGSMGIPSIVTNINGCNEIIINYKNGLLVKPKNILELTDAIEKLLTDHLLYDNLKRNCRDLIVDRYDQKYIWNQILSNYQIHLGK